MFSKYRGLLEEFANKGYEFIKFDNIPNPKLGRKCLALRYDIHFRDINNAFTMLEIEKEVLGKYISTSFVMWRLFGSTNNELRLETSFQTEYQKYIEHCLDIGAEIQPHISPINDYIFKFQPSWQRYNEDELRDIVRNNYQISIDNSGMSINPNSAKDPLNLLHLFDQIPHLLQEYNFLWNQRFGVNVKGYAVHGNDIPFNRILHNGFLLNNKRIVNLKLFEYEVHSSKVRQRLKHYSDCSNPKWIDGPRKWPDMLQLLIHPARWNDKFIADNHEQRVNTGELYLAPLDFITDPLAFIESGLTPFKFNEKTKNCCS